jgi:hypothetical protein
MSTSDSFADILLCDEEAMLFVTDVYCNVFKQIASRLNKELKYAKKVLVLNQPIGPLRACPNAHA